MDEQKIVDIITGASFQEQQIIRFWLTKLKDGASSNKFEITVDELRSLSEDRILQSLPESRIYSNLNRVYRHLSETFFNVRCVGLTAGGEFENIPFYTSFSYDGTIIEFTINKRIIDCLQQKLTEKPISYLLEYYFDITEYLLVGKYSSCLYTQLKRWDLEGLTSYEAEVAELQDILGAYSQSYLFSFGKFKQAVLDPTVNEISVATDLNVSYDLIRTGRKITHILLKWNHKE